MLGIPTFFSLFLMMTSTVASSKVLLVSMDGFRWDYIQNFSTPNFDEFAENGITSKCITSTFITKTFPCHYSIATGLYEESHGIVSNSMYDPISKDYFKKNSLETKWWNGAEPIWVTVQRHGLRSGVYFWPGSEAEIGGKRPNIWKAYKSSVPFTDRVESVIDWLSNDSYGIDLGMVYFHEPDRAGHAYGPYSQQIKDKVYEMDGLLGYIVRSVKSAGLWDKLNLIVTSDHGMAEIDFTNRLIDLRRYINVDAVGIMPEASGVVLSMQPVEGMTDEVYRNLSSADHMTVYKKEDLPERWHYKNNRRVLPLVLVADEGWTIAKDASEITWAQHGGHGYDNDFSSMKPIFFASGPDFKTNFTLPPFNSVDIYPLVCELLGIEPAVNNGTLANTKSALNMVNGGASVITLLDPTHSVLCAFVLSIYQLLR